MTGLVATAAAYLLTWLFDRRLDRVTSRSIIRLAAGVAIGFILSIAWALVATGGLTARTTSTSWLIFAIFAIREELAYHGYPLRTLNKRFGYWPAQLLIAVLFALEHKLAGWTWTTAFGGSFFGSLLFGAAALATGGLAAPIGMHAAWNIGQSIFGPPTPTLRSTLTFAILCVLCVFVVIYSFANGKERADRA